jgi:hypothetical protein
LGRSGRIGVVRTGKDVQLAFDSALELTSDLLLYSFLSSCDHTRILNLDRHLQSDCTLISTVSHPLSHLSLPPHLHDRSTTKTHLDAKKHDNETQARRLQAQRKKEAQREELEERERTSTRPGV